MARGRVPCGAAAVVSQAGDWLIVSAKREETRIARLEKLVAAAMPANVYDPPAATGEGLAASLRGFGPLGLIAIVVILLGNALFTPLSAILALVWARLARVPLRELGFVCPRIGRRPSSAVCSSAPRSSSS